jgi:hypothetical protein
MATEPYVGKNPGDIIRAADWNEIQSKARDELRAHTHTGDTQGPKLTGDAIDPAASLAVASLATGDLTVNTRKLLAEIDEITGRLNGFTGFVAKAGDAMTGQLMANGGIALDGSEIRLRAGNDRGHGLGWFGGGMRFAGRQIDGAVLWGFAGGFLGTASGGERVALEWDQNGIVNVRSPKWRVTQVMNNVPGDKLLPATFQSGGGTLLILCSGSGWSGAKETLIGMSVMLDNNGVGEIKSYTNPNANHIPFVSCPIVHSGVGSGSHTISLRALPNTHIDLNDYFNVTVIEFPF